jgi:hypothetical protein
VIVVPVKGAAHAQAVIAELKEAGLGIEQDFRWAYIPSNYDNWDDHTHTQPVVRIWLIDKSLESFYSLKWT